LPLLEQVLEKYPKEVKVLYKHFPLRNHKQARPAAVASMAAHQQGKFWEYHDKIFADYRNLNDKKFMEFAEALGLDMERFKKSMKDPRVLNVINNDMREAQKAGVRGTPTIYVNGKRLKDRSLRGFSAMIDRELKSR
jgi:protein-disulfide isomerase